MGNSPQPSTIGNSLQLSTMGNLPQPWTMDELSVTYQHGTLQTDISNLQTSEVESLEINWSFSRIGVIINMLIAGIEFCGKKFIFFFACHGNE